ncbi:MAG: hypothetical protein KDC12_01755 [Flavobacteriales bacterium]|nr:hypothetical protein [Flavobacteriales bacterium]
MHSTHFSLFQQGVFGLILLVIAPIGVLGQDSPDAEIKVKQSKIRLIEINEGLSQGMVNGVVEDQDGFLWISTKEGLNKYDGRQFKAYRHIPDDDQSISNNFANGLVVDHKNRIWVGTQNAGVNLYNPTTDKFVRFQADTSQTNTITSNFVGEFYLDHLGNLFVQTLDEHNYSVFLLADLEGDIPDSIEIRPIRAVYPVFAEMHRGGDGSRFLQFDRFGGMWYANIDTLFYAEPGQNTNPHRFELIQNPDPDFSDEVQFHISPHGDRVFTTDQHQRIYEFDYNSKQFKCIFTLPPQYDVYNGLYHDSQNRLWVWEREGTFLRIDLNDTSLTELEVNWNKMQLDSRRMHTGILAEDRNHNLWLGTGGNGLLKISGKGEQFLLECAPEDGLIESTWTYRVENGMGRARHNKPMLLKYRPFLIAHKNFNPQTGMESINEKDQLTVDLEGTLWKSVTLNNVDTLAIIRYNPDLTPEMEVVFRNRTSESEALGSPLFLDADQNIWFGEKARNGRVHLYKYVHDERKVLTYEFPIDGSKYQYRFISDWLFDDSGALWMATMEGVWKFEEDGQSWLHIANDPDNPHSLSNNQCLSICFDPAQPDTYLWIGTEGGGLNRLNLHDLSCARYDVSTGLPNDVVYSILPDSRNNLWFGTNQGLCQFNPTDRSVVTYTRDDGLPSNEFNRYEFSLGDDNRLIFGGMGGIISFDPEDFYSSGIPSKTVISDILLFNEPLDFRDKQRLNRLDMDLDMPIAESSELTFNHDHDMISIQFVCLDLTSPLANKYRYRLKGLSDQWVEAGNRNEATFTDLSPGSYTFEVLGAGSDGVWNEEPTTLILHVRAPWWGTYYAIALWILLGVGLLYIIYHYRLQNMLRYERMRNRIAQDLHDDIGSTLSSISLYSGVLNQWSSEIPDKATSIVRTIGTSAEHMMESMNDIVWSIKTENESFTDLLNRLRSYAANISDASNMRVVFNVSDHVSQVQLQPEQRKNIYLILKESINNAAKYSGGNKVEIDISLKGKKLIAEVYDDGVGFDAENPTFLENTLGGNGLKGMQQRANEIGGMINIRSKPGEGTTIRLECKL